MIMKIIGIDLGGTKISAAVVEADKIIELAEEVTDKKGGIATIEQIKRIIGELIKKHKTIKAIGIGVPAMVDAVKGIVYDVTNIPDWKEVPLVKILKQSFKQPVYINNDANCFALGEKYFGKAKKSQNFVALTIGTGLGAGVVIDNKLYNGRNGGAGEICEIPYLGKTLEYYCSGNFFIVKAKKDGEAVMKLAAAGDKKALALFAEFAEHIANALAITVFTYDPEIIIIGGSVTQSRTYFEDKMIESLEKKLKGETFNNLRIEYSKGNKAVLGAASLCLNAKIK